MEPKFLPHTLLNAVLFLEQFIITLLWRQADLHFNLDFINFFYLEQVTTSLEVGKWGPS